MMERVDVDGRWVSDDGTGWVLVDPSAEWQAGRDALEADAAEQDAAQPPALADGLRVAARMTIDARIVADELDDDTVEQVAALYPAWQPGIDVAVGDLYRHDGTVVECIQAHTTQSDWAPDVTPALWKVHRTETGEWVAGISVEVGETWSYEGVDYTVVQAHTTQAGWEPDVTPALWEPVAA